MSAQLAGVEVAENDGEGVEVGLVVGDGGLPPVVPQAASRLAVRIARAALRAPGAQFPQVALNTIGILVSGRGACAGPDIAG